MINYCGGKFTGTSDTNSYFGVFKSPSNYKATFKNLGAGESINNTFTLKYGGYSFRNLLCEDINIELSTMHAKGSNGKALKDPAYATVSLQLVPASLLVDKDITNFIKKS